jgi:hypothetical protein
LSREPPQLVIHQRQKLRRGGRVAGVDLQEDAGDIGHGGRLGNHGNPSRLYGGRQLPAHFSTSGNSHFRDRNSRRISTSFARLLSPSRLIWQTHWDSGDLSRPGGTENHARDTPLAFGLPTFSQTLGWLSFGSRLGYQDGWERYSGPKGHGWVR